MPNKNNKSDGYNIKTNKKKNQNQKNKYEKYGKYTTKHIRAVANLMEKSKSKSKTNHEEENKNDS